MTSRHGAPIHHERPRGRARWLLWSAFALALALAPQVFRTSLGLSMLAQIGYLIVICLSYNILLGQGGMLSFGHAVYTGLGAFIAVHAMNLAGRGALAVPLVLVPLAGGLAGALFAALLGFVTTRKSGTPFAMISLGIGELVAAVALMFPGFFGGEGGVTANRVYGAPLLGIPGLDFGPPIQVYYLIAAYCLLCTAAMFAFTGTPLGRILNAVRDNPQRVEFIGYDPQRVRYLAFIVAGFFAGIGGGLAAIHFEIVNAAESLGMARSAGYLLFTFLGGAGFFFGPMIGAVLLAFASVLLSEWSRAWLLYLGLAFLFMVMYAPGGFASLVMAGLRVARCGQLGRLWKPGLGLVAGAALPAAGAAAGVEMVYRLQLDAALGPEFRFFGIALDGAAPAGWIASVAALAVGVPLFEFARRRFMRAWARAQTEIEAQTRRREAA